MAKRKCGNCGAPLPRNEFVCAYCGTDWTPDSPHFGVQPEVRPEPAPTPIGPGRVPPAAVRPGGQSFWQRPATQNSIFAVLALTCCPPAALVYAWLGTSWQRRSKVIWTVVLVIPMVLLGLLMYLDTVAYTVYGDFEKVDPSAPVGDQRLIDPVDPGTVYAALVALRDRPMSERQSVWRESYAGTWVQWQGKVGKVNTYTNLPCEMDLDIDQSAMFTVTVYFDPEHADRPLGLRPGQDITISGRLWGYGYLFDDLYLADGAIVSAAETESPPTD